MNITVRLDPGDGSIIGDIGPDKVAADQLYRSGGAPKATELSALFSCGAGKPGARM